MSFAFFRKYNKILLAVGGSILMVLFLLPQTSSSLMGNPGDEVIGTVAGEEITGNDIKTANGEITVLRNMLNARYAALAQQFQTARDAMDLRAALLAQQQIQEVGSVLQSLPDGNDMGLLWILMQHEARQQGLYASQSESRSILQSWGITPDLVAMVKRQMGVDDPFIYQALGHWQMTLRVRQLAFGQAMIPGPSGETFSVRLSEPALRHFARNIQSQVGLDLVAVPASIMLDDIADPTEAEIEERFNLSANVAPGSGQYGFGYRLPPRVKLEYIAIPLERAKQAVAVDEVEANRYYLQHPNEFLPKPPATETPASDADSSAPAPAPAAPAADPTTPRPYREVREDIIEKLTEQKALALQDQAVKLVQASLNLAIRSWPVDQQTGFRAVPPTAASAIDLASIADQVQKDTGIQADVVRNEKDWQPLTTLTAPTGFGSSMLIIGSGENRRGVPVAAYIASVKELLLPSDPVLQQLRLQSFVPAKPVIDREGTIYLFRVLSAEPSHAPTLLAEVRDQVVRDVKMLKAFGSLKTQADLYLNRAKTDGLDKLAASLGDDTKVHTIKPFSRRDYNPQVSNAPIVPTIDVVGQNEQFIDQVFKLAAPAEQAGNLDAIPASNRIAAVPVDGKLTVYIVKLTEYLPLTEQDFNAERDLWALRMGVGQLTAAQQQAGPNPYEIKTLSSRVGFVSAQSERAIDETQTPAPTE